MTARASALLFGHNRWHKRFGCLNFSVLLHNISSAFGGLSFSVSFRNVSLAFGHRRQPRVLGFHSQWCGNIGHWLQPWGSTENRLKGRQNKQAKIEQSCVKSKLGRRDSLKLERDRQYSYWYPNKKNEFKNKTDTEKPELEQRFGSDSKHSSQSSKSPKINLYVKVLGTVVVNRRHRKAILEKESPKRRNSKDVYKKAPSDSNSQRQLQTLYSSRLRSSCANENGLPEQSSPFLAYTKERTFTARPI